jgi:hypothetical protein
MIKKSLFGQLAGRFNVPKENLATEALKYIVTQSPAAAQGFLRHIEQTAGIKLPKELIYSTQEAGVDESIPDMVGNDADGQPALIIEAKFWAGLTENQPLTYLKQLPKAKSSALVFIAPENRIQTLWPSLLTRCKEGGVAYRQSAIENLRITIRDTENVLALTSWRAVLSSILGQLNKTGEIEIAADVAQLQGLCESMDSIAFYPLSSEEFSSLIPQRTFQYKELVKDIAARLKSEGLASTEGLSESVSYGTYGRYMWIHDFGCLLEFDSDAWAKYRETPLWFSIQGKDWKYSATAKKLLSSLEREQPSRLLEIDKWLSVPLSLPTGVDRDEVIRSLISQIKEIAQMLSAGKKD